MNFMTVKHFPSTMKIKVYARYPAEGPSEHEGFPGVCLSQNTCDNYAKLYDISSPGMGIVNARPFYLQLSQDHDPRLILIPCVSGPAITCHSFILPRLQWATISSLRDIFNLSSSQAQPLFLPNGLLRNYVD
jgi:hypothetical protein